MGSERLGFALRHLYVYPRLRLAYTYIPKNACSSLKRTFGRAQGWLTADSPSAHEMRRAWWLSGLARYPRAEERIVVVRDPFDRVLSAYLNKFLRAKDSVAEQAVAAGLGESIGPGATRDDVTFADFVGYLSRTPSRRLDEHWRPQHDFLLGSYTRILRFEHLGEDTAFLAARGLVVDEARGHSTSKVQSDVGPGWGTRTAGELGDLRRRRGVLPSRENMYDDGLRAMINERFAEDVELFESAATQATSPPTGGEPTA